MQRFDYVFSYWLFAWWGLYVLKVTRYSPALWLWAAVLYELGLFAILLVYRYPAWHIALFVAINLVIKGWPLWTLRRETPQLGQSLLPGLALFGVYLGWLRVNGTALSEVTSRAWIQIQERKPFSVGIIQLLQLQRF